MGTAVTQIGDAADSFFVIIDGIAAVPQPTARRRKARRAMTVGVRPR
jgi:hypothetical protein